jgi:hypothetical protein
MATKAQRHKAKLFVKINLCALVSWWRKCFWTKCKEFKIKTLIEMKLGILAMMTFMLYIG